MRVPSPVARFVTGTAALAMLAGCSGAGGGGVNATPVAASSISGVAVQSVAGSRTCGATHTGALSSRFWYPGKPTHPTRVVHAFMNAKSLSTTQRVVVVSDTANGVIDGFDAQGQQIGEITGFNAPDGISSDARGDLFVADSGNDQIVVLHFGAQGTTILSEPGKSPSGVDSFRDGGLVAAANFGDTCNPGGVTFFVHGALKKTITTQSLSSAWFCAFDASGNLYVDGLDANGQPTVGEIVGGVRGTKFTPLTTTNTIEAGVGIRVMATGKIAILDQAGAVYTYNPPSGGSLGSPISTTLLTGTADPIGLAFTKHRDELYVGDVAGGTLDQFRYPGGAKMRFMPIEGAPVGVAIYPSETPGTTQS